MVYRRFAGLPMSSLRDLMQCEDVGNVAWFVHKNMERVDNSHIGWVEDNVTGVALRFPNRQPNLVGDLGCNDTTNRTKRFWPFGNMLCEPGREHDFSVKPLGSKDAASTA
jgi:hypothetical protein